jgi:hypothetical protein
MPRKQRFKPSRKPKPIPQSEDSTLERQSSGAPAHNDNVDMRDAPPMRNDVPMDEPDAEAPSR